METYGFSEYFYMRRTKLRIVFLYDDQDDYNLSNKIEYADFCLKDEAEVIISSLRRLGHSVYVVKGKKAILNDLNIIKQADLVFNKSEGFQSRNREGLIPALLEFMEIPYTGTDAYGFSLSLNKYHTKLIAKDMEILTPNFIIINNEEQLESISKLKYPVIIKPNNEGSSMGCSVFHEYNNEIQDAVKKLLLKFHQPVIVEEYIAGIDISVPIIGTLNDAECLGIVEFSNDDGSYPLIASTEFKYIDHYKTKILRKSDKTMSYIKKLSLQIYNALGCRDYGRIDFRLKNDIPYFLEINPLPTLCTGGAFDVCAHESGLCMDDIINNIIRSAMKRYQVLEK